MNADWALGGRQPLDQANRLGLRVRQGNTIKPEVNWKLSELSERTVTVTADTLSTTKTQWCSI